MLNDEGRTVERENPKKINNSDSINRIKNSELDKSKQINRDVGDVLNHTNDSKDLNKKELEINWNKNWDKKVDSQQLNSNIINKVTFLF